MSKPSSTADESCNSRSSSISSWIQRLPAAPSGFEDSQSSITVPTLGKKKAERSPTHKKRPLAEISGNAMNTSPYNLRKRKNASSPLPNQPISVKRRQVQLIRDEGEEEEEDNEPTPRGPLRSSNLLHVQSTDSSSEAEVVPEDSQSNQPSEGKSEANSMAQSSAASSDMGHMLLLDIKVNLVVFEEPGVEIANDMKALYKDMKSIPKRRCIIPYEVKKVGLESRYMDEDDEDCFMSEADSKKTVPADILESEDFLTPLQIWSTATAVLRAAKECERARLPEPAWNERVHSRLLELALQGSNRSKGIWYHNITTARISDSTLLPALNGMRIRSKMADYALIIEPSPAMQNAIMEKLRSTNRVSINQTKALYTRFDPLGVNIETKRPHSQEDKGFVQIITWVSAQFENYKRLCGDEVYNRSLPIIFTQGHVWKLMIARRRAPDEVYIVMGLTLGSTENILGLYQVMRAIDRLAQWVIEDFKPWFEQKFLGMTETE